MSQLLNLQRQFANHIYNQQNKDIFKSLYQSEISNQDKLEIYRNNIFGNLQSALTLTFANCKKIIGDEKFAFLIQKYIKKFHSKSGNLEDFGDQFPKLIKNFQKKLDLPIFLSQIAQIEWLCNLIYFYPESENIDIASLQNLSPDQLFQVNFQLDKSCHLIKSKYPIYEILNGHKEELKEINLAQQKTQFIIIERANSKVNLTKLDAVEYQFLRLISKQKTIYQIFKNIRAKNKDFDIGALVTKFVSARIINNFYVRNN